MRCPRVWLVTCRWRLLYLITSHKSHESSQHINILGSLDCMCQESSWCWRYPATATGEAQAHSPALYLEVSIAWLPLPPPYPNLWKLLDRFLIRIRAHRVIPWHTHTPPNTLSIRKIWTDISRACNTSRNLEEKRHSSGLKTKWLHEYRARSEIDFYNLTQEGLLAPCQNHTDHSHTSRSPVTIRVSRGNPF